MRVLLFSIILLFIAGCKSDSAKPQKFKSEKKYTITEIDEVELGRIINDRNGRVLFVNVWATWCAPCIEEFPDIVKVSEFYRGKDVDFISLNVDMSSRVDSLVIPFLKSFNADFVIHNIKEKNAEKVINLLNPEWSGAIPATFIYDKNGTRKIFILGTEKFQNFVSAVDSVRSL